MGSILIFLGPPGSGKGTQAQKLCDENGYIQVSTGDLLRQAVKNQTEVGLKVKEVMQRGDLVSDDIILQIMKEKFLSENLVDGAFILDGFPRTITQAEQLNKMLDAINLNIDYVFNFKLSMDTVVERITNRLICKSCNRIYKKSEVKTLKCTCQQKGDLIARVDDKADKAIHRYEQFLSITKPLEEFYSQIIETIDASQNEENIYNSISEKLKKKKLKNYV